MENDVRVTVNGWVSSEPQLRAGPNGDFMTFRMGSTPRYRQADGEYAELKTEWFDIKIRGKALSNNVRHSVRKGDPVIVVGRLTSHQWEAKDGSTNWAMQVQADLVGHDLRWGDTRFTKVAMAAHRRGPEGQDQAAGQDQVDDLARGGPAGGTGGSPVSGAEGEPAGLSPGAALAPTQPGQEMPGQVGGQEAPTRRQQGPEGQVAAQAPLAA
ncbi:MAG: single-stranded DNA-binding protein [Micrococcales bacterium]|nr:single-stranded DNA-binding protein [Micrococcales bacterium]